MLFVSFATYLAGARRWGSLRLWTTAGCVASALPMVALAFSASAGPGFPLRATVFALGFFNGVFAAAAIGSMMALAHAGPKGRAGTRMGLWGAAQAFGFGLGGFGGAVAVDLARQAAALGASGLFSAVSPARRRCSCSARCSPPRWAGCCRPAARAPARRSDSASMAGSVRGAS